MIVDDSDFMRMRCLSFLQEQGFETFEAENGRTAVEVYKKVKPDIVFMDVTMPDMDGIEAVRQIKAIDPRAVIAMLSGMGQQSLIIEAIKAGAKDFVVKPFEPNKILNSIDKLLNTKPV